MIRRLSCATASEGSYGSRYLMPFTTADNSARTSVRWVERFRAFTVHRPMLLQGSESFFGRAAQSFLLDPANNVRRTIFDRDLSRLGRTKEYHRVAVHKGHIRKIERCRLRRAALRQQPFDFRQVLLRELPA